MKFQLSDISVTQGCPDQKHHDNVRVNRHHGIMHFNDFTPGRALLMSHVLATKPGCGLRDGTALSGPPISIGSTHTTFRGGPAGTEYRRANEDLSLWSNPFVMKAFTQGVALTDYNAEGFKVFAPRWSWLGWTVAQHLDHDRRPEAVRVPLVIVGCGAAKSGSKQPAAELYTGTYFKLGLRAARALVPDDRIRILSAKHGLVPLHRMIDPYDVRIGDAGAITIPELRAEAKRCGLKDCYDVTVLAGHAYANLARAVWPHVKVPLSGTRGIGDQQHVLTHIAAGGGGC